ncbi:hypothetical protein ACFYUY_04725 [Kitasatospora sp. NPDC004745]|uniref:hypothetical protein n=1 Tax=Kitasatospora sp. NPDC004745 TaxID=3364019 RepID=UPI0036AC1429
MTTDSEPNFADVALHALAEHREEQQQEARVRAEDFRHEAWTAAEDTFGFIASLLIWAVPEPDDEAGNLATAPIPGTPGWFLRWRGGSTHEARSTFELVRPCSEGGHCDAVYGLSDIGIHLERLNKR